MRRPCVEKQAGEGAEKSLQKTAGGWPVPWPELSGKTGAGTGPAALGSSCAIFVPAAGISCPPACLYILHLFVIMVLISQDAQAGQYYWKTI